MHFSCVVCKTRVLTSFWQCTHPVHETNGQRKKDGTWEQYPRFCNQCVAHGRMCKIDETHTASMVIIEITHPRNFVLMLYQADLVIRALHAYFTAIENGTEITYKAILESMKDSALNRHRYVRLPSLFSLTISLHPPLSSLLTPPNPSPP
eukprot:TRINITY_DN3753_c0_g1_i4.p2 TRINITY_DN3753_c0_g1~~TRINITY_DN3753_c0_g1_i4.p2  ORF type:complete len:150 (-),score=21.38 TRINITY_DN3753_c0_g1_i4:52-501(-)